MAISCNISGVPRMIHTNTRTTHRSGRKRLIEPKLMISPSGRENKSVKANIFRVIPKPSKRASETRINSSFMSFDKSFQADALRISCGKKPDGGKTERFSLARKAESPFFASFLPVGKAFDYSASRASVSSYFSASAGSVPSLFNSSMMPLTFSARSESLRKPMPYSSEVRERP